MWRLIWVQIRMALNSNLLRFDWLSFADVSSENRLQKILVKRNGNTQTPPIFFIYYLLNWPTSGKKKSFNLFPLSLIYVVAEAEHAPSKSSVAIPSPKAQEFLAKLSRTKRNVWDRSRPDVQQWIMQFMQMGFDEQASFLLFTFLLLKNWWVLGVATRHEHFPQEYGK